MIANENATYFLFYFIFELGVGHAANALRMQGGRGTEYNTCLFLILFYLNNVSF